MTLSEAIDVAIAKCERRAAYERPAERIHGEAAALLKKAKPFIEAAEETERNFLIQYRAATKEKP